MSALVTEDLGVVVIGRNEGDRLKRCIKALLPYTKSIVYVDSGSTDGSPEWVMEQGLHIANLDMIHPFTAARARNEGFTKLCEIFPQVNFVQFVDGDCEIQPEWLSKSQAFLASNTSVAVACGRRREKNIQDSIFNALCDIEWNTEIGEAKACGGDSLMRADVLKGVGGFRPDVIAGEEPELCFRIRHMGYKIWRLDEEMTLHDANITKLSQWWKRAQRAGYAYALGASIHGCSEERFRVREVVRILFWGGAIPISTIVISFLSPSALLLLAVYPLQYVRLRAKNSKAGKFAGYWAFYTVLGKFPECIGVVSFFKNHFLGRRASIIEYK